MAEHPILFADRLVRAILEGRKTQTRRPVRRQPRGELVPSEAERGAWRDTGFKNPLAFVRCPLGAPGDTLWVREAWYSLGRCEPIGYRADNDALPGIRSPRWRPSMHMPRWASRITLRVESVRVERIQSITYEDMDREGVDLEDPDSIEGHEFCRAEHAQIGGVGLPTTPERCGFAALWDSHYRSSAPWSLNPWVWAIAFSVAEVKGRD